MTKPNGLNLKKNKIIGFDFRGNFFLRSRNFFVEDMTLITLVQIVVKFAVCPITRVSVKRGEYVTAKIKKGGGAFLKVNSNLGAFLSKIFLIISGVTGLYK